jgi:hypothetical protein
LQATAMMYFQHPSIRRRERLYQRMCRYHVGPLDEPYLSERIGEDHFHCASSKGYALTDILSRI